MLRKHNIIRILLLSGAIITSFCSTSSAHPYMYYDGEEYWQSLEELAEQMDNILDDICIMSIGCPLWSQDCQGANSALWRRFEGQDGPYWNLGDNGAVKPPNPNTPWSGLIRKNPNPPYIYDSRYLGLLDAVLDPNRATNLPPTVVNSIRTAFQNNIARVLQSEVVVQNVRVTFTLSGCDNDFYFTYRTNSTFCQRINYGQYCLFYYDYCFDIPSLLTNQKGGPLLGDPDPRLDDAIVNLTAAYMTLGDPRSMDYWYSFCGNLIQITLESFLDDLMNQIDKKSTKSYENNIHPNLFNQILPLENEKNGSKALCYPWGTVSGIDFTTVISTDFGNINLRVRVSDTDVCNAIQNFVNNHIAPSQYTTMGNYLSVNNSSNGDLNGDGRRNFLTYIDTWGSSNQNPSVWEWALREDIFPKVITLETQPIGRTTPPLYYMYDSWTMSIAVDEGDGNIWTANNLPPTTPRFSYQWLYGDSPGNVNTPVSGGNTRVLNLNPVDWIGSRYFRCQISDPQSIATTFSNVVEVKTQLPVFVSSLEINPPSPIILYTPFSITCNAQDTVLGPLSYQWQIDRDIEGPQGWENVNDGNSDHIYQVTSSSFNDQGWYRCLVTSQTFNVTITAGPITVEVIRPIPEVTLQPVGGMINIGGSHTFQCNGNINPYGGADLQFRWEKNRSPIGSIINGPGPVQLSITNAQLSDAGWYRCKITSQTYGTFTYTNEVYLGVGVPPSGNVFRVDKMAPRPGGVEDGLTWETAFNTIQEGIDSASSAGGGEVWVAGGPNGGGYVYGEYRTIPWGSPASVEGSLILKDNVQIYGGFEGYAGIRETSRSQRRVRNSITIIDGSVSRGGAPAYHVIVVGNANQPALNVRIDGFDIRGGRALGVAGDYHTWRGAGIYNWGSQVTIENCTFYNNISAVAGGAIANETNITAYADTLIINCVFYQNRANRVLDSFNNPLRGGGAIFNNRADADIRFCTFVGNTIDSSVGGTLGLSSSAILNYGIKGTGRIHSCIFWNNSPGCIENICSSPTNCPDLLIVDTDTSQTIDPQFVDVIQPPTFILSLTSPFKDNSSLTSPNYDIRGIPRNQDSAPDRGAYETLMGTMTIVCKDRTVQLDNSGNAIVNASSLIDYDNSIVPGGIWSVRVNNAETITLTCADIPSKQVTVVVTDYLGAQGMCNATITVQDNQPPTLQLRGNPWMLLKVGEDCYTEQGAYWTDNCDGTGEAVITGDAVPTHCPLVPEDIGTYTVRYNYTDSHGNSATELTRTIRIGYKLQFITHPLNTDLYLDSPPIALTSSFTGGFNVSSYTWLQNGSIIQTGNVAGNQLSLWINPANMSPGTYMYKVVIDDLEGSHHSNEARIRIGEHIQIIQNISSDLVIPGSNYSLSIIATGGIGSLQYLWQKYTNETGWVEIEDRDNIQGSMTNTLVFTPFLPEDAGRYRCMINDEFTDVVLSEEATLSSPYVIPVTNPILLLATTILMATLGCYRVLIRITKRENNNSK